MTLFILLFSIAFGVGSLAFGYHLAGFTPFVRWIIFFGALWLVTVWQRWRWFAYLGIAFNLIAAALGLWLLNFSPGWMFAGAIGGLLAFDLTFFWERVRFMDSDEERRGLETRHLVRISLLTMIGMTLASLAMLIKFQFNLAWAILWILILTLGLIQLVIWLRKRS
ncbi:MAG TPA: hypothetical protein VIN60_02780 [Anaerolineales bacterium]